ncbi:MAG TPA: hypothetical protein DF613_08055 [Lachnospiraceae bacterium]|nr:hypothetical protein [Lachnospiraceae bacterium]
MKKATYGQASPEPVRTFIFLGDSITDSGHLWDDDPRCLGQGYVRKIADNLSDPSCRLVNLGQEGFTTGDVLRLLRREEQALADLLCRPETSSKAPCPCQTDTHCVSLLIGANDLSVAVYADPSWIPDRFAANIHEILSLIRCFHTGPLFVMEPFLFPTPSEHRHWFPLLDKEHRILREAAGQYGCLYLPLQNILNRAAAKQGERLITPDGIHLTGEGNRIVAGEWLKAYSAAFFS